MRPRAPEDQRNLGSRAAADLSAMLAAGWLGEAPSRRSEPPGARRGNPGDGARAGAGPDPRRPAAHAQASLSAGTNAILLESAVQNAEAGETTVRALHTRPRSCRKRATAGTNAEEMRLDAQ